MGLTVRELLDRAHRKQLVVWREPAGPCRYPKWQFGSNKLLPGVVDCLQELNSSDQWAVLRFFLVASEQAKGRRPLDLLRNGEVAFAKEIARGQATPSDSPKEPVCRGFARVVVVAGRYYLRLPREIVRRFRLRAGDKVRWQWRKNSRSCTLTFWRNGKQLRPSTAARRKLDSLQHTESNEGVLSGDELAALCKRLIETTSTKGKAQLRRQIIQGFYGSMSRRKQRNQSN